MDRILLPLFSVSLSHSKARESGNVSERTGLMLGSSATGKVISYKDIISTIYPKIVVRLNIERACVSYQSHETNTITRSQ